MLSQARIHATLPASDLARARRFYEGVLGFPPDVQDDGVLYRTVDGSEFLVFPSSGRPSGTHTQLGFTVGDLASEMADLASRGVAFESYDFPGFDRSTSIATFSGSRSAWFKDTEGNLLGVVEFAND